MGSPRVWLISGCSSGFGRHLAEAALRAGDVVVATARHPESLDELAASAPDQVLAVGLDVTRAEQIEAAVAAALARFGRIDVLVNNAGYGTVGAVEEIDSDDLLKVLDTMFFGAVALTQAVLPHLRAQRSGTVVSMSSMGGQVAPPGFGAYCAAKFALEAISESLAAEVAPFGIGVLIVEPGSFRTGFGGARMHRSREIRAYEPTVGPTRAAVDAMDGNQPGDPRRAADAIVATIADPQPPLRLALGGDAVDALRAKHERLRADLDGWEHVSRNVQVQ